MSPLLQAQWEVGAAPVYLGELACIPRNQRLCGPLNNSYSHVVLPAIVLHIITPVAQVD
jgi:hypothetical protein